jgi:hypothetical protein
VNVTPTARLISSLASWVWLDETAAGPVAFLLLAHPDAIAALRELTALADGLGLKPAGQQLPDTGPRVALVGDQRAAVCVDGCRHLVQVEVGQSWSAFVRAGGPVVLLLGLASLPRCADRDEVESYLGASALNGQLRLGSTRKLHNNINEGCDSHE